jgi:phage shock protein A
MSARLFRRVTALLRINVDDLLMDTTDPNAAMARAQADLENGLTQIKDAVAAAVTRLHHLERQAQAAQAACAAWDAKTDAALQAGDDERARQALQRQLDYQRAAELAQAEWERQQRLVVEMKTNVEALQAKLEQVKGKMR